MSFGIDLDAIGAKVKDMRKTRSGDLLVELAGGKQAEPVAAKMSKALAEKMTGVVVTNLSTCVDMEITGIDSTADSEEVMKVVRHQFDNTEGLTDYDRNELAITGLWAVRSGHQVATFKMTRLTANKINEVKISWMLCKVRPHLPEPDRCYRCHGFGHKTWDCKDNDLSISCRRCGIVGHTEKQCTAGEDTCVACDSKGHKKVAHRPGSEACAARREAIKQARLPTGK